MKQPEIIRAPLTTANGGPSPALFRAAFAWMDLDRGSQLAAVLKTTSQNPPRFVLASTYSSAETAIPVGAVLAECLPGRAAVVMTPQVADSREQLPLGSSLLLGLDDILREQRILLAQALTPSRNDAATLTFLNAGYTIAGELQYLAADLADLSSRPLTSPASGIELVPHDPADDARWIPLIDETYLGTLDCPAVDGLRPTSDVLAGYRDIGRPRDDWWFIARHEDRDVGCLILADHSPAKHAELVYMGLIPAVRGRGWGVQLATQAQHLAAQSTAAQLILSVDASNTPALRHYQSAGFRIWEQRTILIKSLQLNPTKTPAGSPAGE